MYNPYTNADFTHHIPSVSHYHCIPQRQFDALQTNGILHLGISNYYPSKPYYPISDYFEPYDGAIECPNAEHHNFGNPFGVSGRLHLNGLGSLKVSGSPSGETPIGFGGLNYKTAITEILAELLYPDAGGITINHPTWTGLSAKNCCDILDYDYRILGIEFYNQSSEEDDSKGWSIDQWDAILRTGRKCFGFSVPDHSESPILAKNILLCNSTVYDCLKAYRDGAFYGKIGSGNLQFDSIEYTNGTLSVSLNKSADIKIITDSSTYTTTAQSLTRQYLAEDFVYMRIEARSDGDSLFSNPVMLDKEGTEITSDSKSYAVHFAHYFHC